MLEVRRLRLLSELAREGTIASVARRLDYTPSAVSQQLIALEREAGVTLLERDGRRVRLTPAAHALVERADRILAELDAAQADLDATRDEPTGPVSVAAFPSVLIHVVAPALAKLKTRYPQLTPAVHQLDPEDGLSALRAGQIDVLISKRYDGAASKPAAGGLESHLLFQEPVVVALPPDHHVGGHVVLADLADERWIAGTPGTAFGALVTRACRAAGFEPVIAHRADEVAVQLALVDAGFGLTLLPALALHDTPARYAQLDKPRLTCHIDALTRAGGSRRPAVAATLRAIARSGKTATALPARLV